MAELSFDARQHQPAQAFDPMPRGWYLAMIDESELKPTKSGLGDRLNLRFSVLKPEKFANRKVFIGLNIQHQNELAQQIAQGQLSAICHAIGKLDMKDTEDLHGVPMHVRLKIDPGSEGYEPRNDITGYKSADSDVTLVDPDTPTNLGTTNPSEWGKTSTGKTQAPRTANHSKTTSPSEQEEVPKVPNDPPW